MWIRNVDVKDKGVFIEVVTDSGGYLLTITREGNDWSKFDADRNEYIPVSKREAQRLHREWKSVYY
ncbi:hypothetical protein ACTHHL_04380 [Aeribacillus composti]|uniref:hypothetical protein n=1 Tax=Aeribacillus composti TaxID=1868734 RepID=UPI00406A4955